MDSKASSSEALYQAGVAALDEGNNVEGMRLLTLAAQQGNSKAQHALAMHYLGGYGVPQNTAEAVRLWELAVAQGHASAHYCLGRLYEKGVGVPKDLAKAVKLIKLASTALSPGEKRVGFQLFSACFSFLLFYNILHHTTRFQVSSRR
jgi:TPR repeat protein